MQKNQLERTSGKYSTYNLKCKKNQLERTSGKDGTYKLKCKKSARKNIWERQHLQAKMQKKVVGINQRQQPEDNSHILE